MKKLIFTLLFLMTSCGPETALHEPILADPERQTIWEGWATRNPSWIANATPHAVIGNVYSVGTQGLGSYLITTNQGHILLDGGLPQNAAIIRRNVERLGFDIRDVDILLNSHAHFDHSGGLASLKAMSGAKMIAHSGDVSALENGYYLGAEANMNYAAPPVSVDRTITDGDTVSLGGVEMIAHHTPGHSRGCTSWSMSVKHEDKTYDILFFCSATVAGNRLEPEQYLGIVEDYRQTFSTLRDRQPDIPLSNHPNFFFDQSDKAQERLSGNVLAYVDVETFPQTIRKLEKSFVRSLAKQRDYESQIQAFRFDPKQSDPDKHYLFYFHGKAIEDQGLSAVSPDYGEYQYIDILNALTSQGFTVFSELRTPETDTSQAALDTVSQIKALIDRGISAKNITILGASKGAYIASLISHELKSPEINLVVLAGCNPDVIDHMLGNDIGLHGRVLAIRDELDIHASGSCEKVFEASTGLTDTNEIIVETGLSHGLIFRPLTAWLAPLNDWANK